ncbi:MAG: hypothetical protein M3066_06840 [Actinomycetota bacterium]|nr:hypothetical protein [Actinomycetota bacterium]
MTIAQQPIDFPLGGSAWAIDVPADAGGDDLLAALALPTPRSTVVVNGTAAGIGPELGERLAAAFGDGGLAGAARRGGLTTVTGGTDAGIFSILGRAMAGCPAPMVGVAPRGLVTWPGRVVPGPVPASCGDRVGLEPHHSHFVLVAGTRWGEETAVLLALARALGALAPSVAVVCGGGPVTQKEALGHVRDGRRVVVLVGSGRFADELAAAAGARASDDPGIAEIVASGLLTLCPLRSGAQALVDSVMAALDR